MLRGVMDYVNRGGINVVFTPGRFNAAYFEHSYLAEITGSVLAEASDMTVENEVLYYGTGRERRRVGTIYRRVSDEYLDPIVFEADSMIGIANIMSVYRAGNVAIMNAPGNGAADDKGIYYFVPKMIAYYLKQEPILRNAPTYLPFYAADLQYTLEHLDTLVIKDVAEAGGYGVIFGRDLTQEKLSELKQTIIAEPRRFITQEVIDFLDLPTLEDDARVSRKADLRAYVLAGESVSVWPSGLTRFSRNPDSFVVNFFSGRGV